MCFIYTFIHSYIVIFICCFLYEASPSAQLPVGQAPCLPSDLAAFTVMMETPLPPLALKHQDLTFLVSRLCHPHSSALRETSSVTPSPALGPACRGDHAELADAEAPHQPPSDLRSVSPGISHGTRPSGGSGGLTSIPHSLPCLSSLVQSHRT